MKARFNYFKAPENETQKDRHIMFYCEWGDVNNKNVIICVHGLSRNSRDFDYIASSLAEKYRVICVDIVGRGKSEWLSDKSQYDYENYAEDIIKLLDHLSITKLDWLGTSMGGIIGMIVASKHPELIKSLVLNDIGPIIPGSAIERILNAVNSQHEFDNKIEAEKAFREKMATFGIKKEEHWQHLIKHSIIKKLNSKYTFTYDPQIVQKPKLKSKLRSVFVKIMSGHKKSGFNDVNLMSIWEKISCRILVLRGENSDVLTKEIALQMQESNEKVKIIEFEKIGHAPMLMETSQIDAVKNWLLTKK